MVLAVLSTAIGARVRIVLDSNPEQGNLYLLSVLDSGNRKSEVKAQLAAPLNIFQKARQDAMAPIIREAENKQRILEKRLDKLEKQAAAADDPVEREILRSDCSDLLKEIEENPIPVKPTYLVDDITLERLGGIMCDNDERGAVLSAEGGIFKLIGGLYSKGHSNIDLILEVSAPAIPGRAIASAVVHNQSCTRPSPWGLRFSLMSWRRSDAIRNFEDGGCRLGSYMPGANRRQVNGPCRPPLCLRYSQMPTTA